MTTHTDLINATGVRVLIDLTDVSAYVKSETLMIKDTGGIEVETCTFAMRPLSPAVTLEWKDCQVIADLDDASSVYLFAGFVTRPVSAFADNGVETEIEVRAEGYKTLLARSKPFSDYYKGVTVEAMVESMLFDAELFDFTCNTQSEKVSYWDISIDESIAKNLDRFCKERNWVWRVGYNKSVTIGPESADVFGDWGIAEAQYVNMSTLYPVENIALESDASMIANAVMVIGGVATSDTVTEKFTGDGTTENFFLSARPIGSIISIMVDEVYVSWGTIGYHSCAERDCLVHFESGYVRFCTAPLTGEVIRIQYNYQFPYTYTAYDAASQALYGKTLWTLAEASWITDDTAAAAYVAAIFEQAATAPKRTSCDLRRIGPRAGQSIACRFPSLGVGTPSVSETMLIESIGTTIDGRYPVQTLRLGPATERLLGTLETLLGGGTSSAKVASSSDTSDHGLLTGLADDDHTQYLLADGSRTGAVSQKQTLASGVLLPTLGPITDSTTALRIQDASGLYDILVADTLNRRLGVRGVPDNPLHVFLPAVGTASYLKLSSATASTFSTYLGTTASNQYAWFTNIRYTGSGWQRDDVTRAAWRMNQVISAGNSHVAWSHWDASQVETTPMIVYGNGNFGLGPITNYATLLGAAIAHVNGNVGIGTNSPQAKLHVNGAIMVTSGIRPAVNGVAAIQFQNVDGTAMVTIDTEYARLGINCSPSVGYGQLVVRPHAASTVGQAIWMRSSQVANAFDIMTDGGVLLYQFKPSGVIESQVLDNATTSITEGLILRHNSSGTPGKGFGTGIAFKLKTDSVEDDPAAKIEVMLNGAAHASYTTDMRFLVHDASGPREPLRLATSGSAPLIGFFANAPVGKQVLNGYTSDVEAGTYDGIENSESGKVYAKVDDLEALRVAYENLRLAFENLRQAVVASTLIGSP